MRKRQIQFWRNVASTVSRELKFELFKSFGASSKEIAKSDDKLE